MDSLFDSTIGSCRTLHDRCHWLNVVVIVACFFAGLAFPNFAAAQTTVNNNWPPSITPTPGAVAKPSTPPPSSFKPSSIGTPGIAPAQAPSTSAAAPLKKQPPNPQGFLGNSNLKLSPTSPPAPNALVKPSGQFQSNKLQNLLGPPATPSTATATAPWQSPPKPTVSSFVAPASMESDLNPPTGVAVAAFPAQPTSTSNAVASPAAAQPQNSLGASKPRTHGKTATATTNTAVASFTKTPNDLPSAAGQIWQEYDITPYTSQITNNKQPERSIVDWILRETGTEMWFYRPLGILNADKEKLYVYHTPEIQKVVKNIVERFNRTRGQVQNVDLHMMTIEKPNWRSDFYTILQPINVATPGTEAWILSKENAAILINSLTQRPEIRKHNSGRLSNHDGQTMVVEKITPVEFIRNLKWVPNQVPAFQPQQTRINEGYRLELSCLSSMDNSTIEAVIKCNVDQVEKLTKVKVDVPVGNGTKQEVTLQIPQLVSWRLHERFRWRNDQVLMLSCGVVASPEPENDGIGLRIPGLPQKSNQAEALLFIEYRGPAQSATIPQTANKSTAPVKTP
ncbi:hypothetical protein N9B05_03390 [Mariniblastus sp.]|nr:hypothetical protein [Mariniblastus sp.]